MPPTAPTRSSARSRAAVGYVPSVTTDAVLAAGALVEIIAAGTFSAHTANDTRPKDLGVARQNASPGCTSRPGPSDTPPERLWGGSRTCSIRPCGTLLNPALRSVRPRLRADAAQRQPTLAFGNTARPASKPVTPSNRNPRFGRFSAGPVHAPRHQHRPATARRTHPVHRDRHERDDPRGVLAVRLSAARESYPSLTDS